MNDETVEAQRCDNPRDIVERTAEFADRIIKLSFALPSNAVGWEIGRPLVRAGMSVGANVEEAQGGESKADFLHKMRIARKECREAKYFLNRVANGELIAAKRVGSIIDEADQLVRILTAIIVNADRPPLEGSLCVGRLHPYLESEISRSVFVIRN